MLGRGKLMLHNILDLFLPNVCLCCRDHFGGLVCSNCLGSISISKISSSRVRGVDSVTSFTEYKGVMSQLIQYYKLQGFTSLGSTLGEYFLSSMMCLDWTSSVIINVPSHSKRYKERGFDHVTTLYDPLAKTLDLEFASLLKRTRQTPALVGLNKFERINVMKGSISSIDPRINLEGRNVILCDDILTTGTTLSECAVTCRQLGASSVHAVTFAEVYDV